MNGGPTWVPPERRRPAPSERLAEPEPETFPCPRCPRHRVTVPGATCAVCAYELTGRAAW